MPANPTLIVGVGDAGAYTVAATKRRMESMLGAGTPGVAYFAVIGDDSQIKEGSRRVEDDLTVRLAQSIASTMDNPMQSRRLPDPAEILGSMWLGSAESREAELVKRLEESPEFLDTAIQEVEDALETVGRKLAPVDFEELVEGVTVLLREALTRERNTRTEHAESLFVDAVKKLSTVVAEMKRTAGEARKQVARAITSTPDSTEGFGQVDLASCVKANTSKFVDDAKQIGRSMLSALGGALGIARKPEEFHSALKDRCREWLLTASPDSVLRVEVEDLRGPRLQELGPDEYAVLRVSGVDGEVSESGYVLDEPTRATVRNAFLEDGVFSEMGRRLSDTIVDLISAGTIVPMRGCLAPLGVEVENSLIRLVVIADTADAFGGAIHNEITARVLQICDINNIEARVTGIFVLPQVLPGAKSAALPQARAYSAIKEICHWADNGKYQLRKDDQEIIADRPLFNYTYVVQGMGFDIDRNARLLSTPMADFIVTSFLDDTRRLNIPFESDKFSTTHPISSFGASSLQFPRRTVITYGSLRAAQAVSEAMKSPDEGDDDSRLVTWSPQTSLRSAVSKGRNIETTSATEAFKRAASLWLEEVRVAVARELDNGPLGVRFERANSIIAKAVKELDESVPVMSAAAIASLVDRESKLKEEKLALAGPARQLSRQRSIAGASSLVSLGVAAVPALPMIMGSSPGLLSLVAGFFGPAAPLVACAGAVLSAGTGIGFFRSSSSLKRNAEERKGIESQLKNITDQLEPILGPESLRLIYVLLIRWQIDRLRHQLRDLEGAIRDAGPRWGSRANQLKDEMDILGPRPDQFGRILLLTEGMMERQAAEAENALAKDVCRVEFSQYLSSAPRAMQRDLPRHLADRLDSEGVFLSNAAAALDDMSRNGEDVISYLKAMKLASDTQIRLDVGSLSVKPPPLVVLSLRDKQQAEKLPLKSHLAAAGLDPVAGSQLTLDGADDTSIVTCQTLDMKVGVCSLLLLPAYYRSYLETGCTEMVAGDPKAHAVMKDPCGGLDESLAKKVMVLSLALDLLRPPGMPQNDLEPVEPDSPARLRASDPAECRALLSMLERDTDRQRTLESLITSRCNTDTVAPIVSWLQWVCDHQEWWGGVLGLVEPDLAYIHRLIDDLKSGKAIGGTDI